MNIWHPDGVFGIDELALLDDDAETDNGRRANPMTQVCHYLWFFSFLRKLVLGRC